AQHAGIVLRNALFRLPAKVDENAVPWCTYTEPELAQLGPTEAQARERFGDDVVVTRFDYAGNDRAQAERATEGFVKVVSRRNGRVLGAGIVGRYAGDLIQGWALPVARGLKLSAVAGLVLAYPTLSEINKRAAGNFYSDKIFSDRVRKLVRFLLRLP
ncbi:MAG: dihydrolipoamide dehydrogenase, partial [Reyranellaceae bacterium]